MDLSEAFVPLRPLGVDYTGGVLEGPARVAIHFTHRLGALLLCLLLAIATGTVLRSPHASRAQRSAARLALAALGLQLTLGAAMILRGFPVWLATLHAAGAALLLLSTLGLLRRLSEPVTAAAPEHALDHGAARVAAPS
jgi:cytochrome c oxidase assembly protein subunit 15